MIAAATFSDARVAINLQRRARRDQSLRDDPSRSQLMARCRGRSCRSAALSQALH